MVNFRKVPSMPNKSSAVFGAPGLNASFALEFSCSLNHGVYSRSFWRHCSAKYSVFILFDFIPEENILFYFIISTYQSILSFHRLRRHILLATFSVGRIYTRIQDCYGSGYAGESFLWGMVERNWQSYQLVAIHWWYELPSILLDKLPM